MEVEKQKVKDFWNDASCGENLYLQGANSEEQFNAQSKARYQLEPYILSFADFKSQQEKRVLEIGVGLGADHQKFAENGGIMTGVDITPRAIDFTKQRFDLFGLTSDLQVADVEKLPFADNSFDTVYSWGVIHHSPNTTQAVNEIFRVLKDKGIAKIMIYNKYSFVGYMLWVRYGLLRLRPFTTLNDIYSKYLESPGTKAYTRDEAKELFSQFKTTTISIQLTHGDLLSSDAGQRHRGPLLSIAKRIFPASLVKVFFPNHGLFLLITATKH